MTWFAAFAVLALLVGAAARYGVDSRDGCDWLPLDVPCRPRTPVRRHTPSRDVARLTGAVAARSGASGRKGRQSSPS